MTQLFVQCLRSETPFYLQFADETLCDEELKYALLALNCDLPGMSTFVTLVIHTAKGIDDDVKTDWKVHINRSAGMEIYDVKVSYILDLEKVHNFLSFRQKTQNSLTNQSINRSPKLHAKFIVKQEQSYLPSSVKDECNSTQARVSRLMAMILCFIFV